MILCLDLETTGLDAEHCGLVEIGACWLHSGESFFRACRPLPTALIEPAALAVNGWTAEKLADPNLLPEEHAVSEFIGWVRGREANGNARVQIAAWNAHFDHRHLCAGMDRAGYEELHRPFTHRLIDVHSVLAMDEMRRKLPASIFDRNELVSFGNEVANCDEAAKLLQMPLDPRPHTA